MFDFFSFRVLLKSASIIQQKSFQHFNTRSNTQVPFGIISFVLAAVVGMASMQIGVCIQHDGNHGAFAESRILNRLAGWTLDLISASAFTWEVQHVLGWVFVSLYLLLSLTVRIHHHHKIISTDIMRTQILSTFERRNKVSL